MDNKCAFLSKTRTFLSDPKLLNGSVHKVDPNPLFMQPFLEDCNRPALNQEYSNFLKKEISLREN
jgi:hypothetical protein